MHADDYEVIDWSADEEVEVDWTKVPTFILADEIEALQALEWLRDELEKVRSQELHTMRYMLAAIRAAGELAEAGLTTKEAIILYSGVARQTVFNALSKDPEVAEAITRRIEQTGQLEFLSNRASKQLNEAADRIWESLSRHVQERAGEPITAIRPFVQDNVAYRVETGLEVRPGQAVPADRVMQFRTHGPTPAHEALRKQLAQHPYWQGRRMTV